MVTEVLTLSLLRHAKSSWDDAALDDFDRPLAPRGRKAAPLMARAIADQAIVPDIILCSPAVRTRQTLALVLATVGERLPRHAITFDRQLYHGAPDDLLAVVARMTPPHRHVMIVGHNPGLQELAIALLDASSPSAGGMAVKFPTAAVAVIDVVGGDGWTNVRGRGRLRLFLTPGALSLRAGPVNSDGE